MAIQTQGTQVYFINPLASGGPEVVEIECPTGVTGLSMPKENIETTCLDSSARTYVPGLATPGAATITINFDPRVESHLQLNELWRSNEVVPIAIGFSDGTDAPTLNTAGDGFVFPTTRSYVYFEGFVQDIPLDFSLNAVVTADLTIQVSGPYIVYPAV